MPMKPYPHSSRKRSWSRPLADLVGAAIHPVLARQGFAETDLILHWGDIVGDRLAANSRPIKLTWPPRPPGRLPETPPQPATLVIRVEGGFALELQHMGDQVLARINAHLGWRCVGRLTLKQGPIERVEATAPRNAEPSSRALAAASDHVVDIEEDGLRAALTRLGAHVLEA